MQKYVGLLKREWLEHGPAFYWSMGVLLIILILSLILAFAFEANLDVELSAEQQEELRENMTLSQRNGDVSGLEMLTALALDTAGSTDAELRTKMSAAMAVIAQAFHWVFLVVSIFALIAVLYDERKDHSILFYKSLPVTDTESVLSKYVFVAWVAPVVVIAGVFIAQTIVLLAASITVEDGQAGRLWAASEIWSRPFHALFGYLLQGLWVLPTYAWVMLVSAVAPKVPLLWAFAIPMVISWFESLLFGQSSVAQWLLSHGAPAALPDVHRFINDGEGGAFAYLAVLRQGDFWVGVLIGVGLLALTVIARRRYIAI
ncbi:MAG: ABC-2 transporter permease [Pseudomonadota bacterium]